MKCTLIAIALLAGSATAWAQDDDTLPPVVVEHYDGSRVVVDCEPPTDSPNCTYYHALLRQNFTPHELALLFGPATGYADYRTSYSMAREHYAAFLDDIAVNGLPVPARAVSSVEYER